MPAVVGFTLAPKFTTDARKEASKLSAEIRGAGKVTDTLSRSLTKTSKDATKSWRDFAKTVKDTSSGVRDLGKNFGTLEGDIHRVGRASSSAFGAMGRGIVGAGKALDGLKSKLFSVQTLVAGSAAYLGGKALLGAAHDDASVRRRATREFGATRAKELETQAKVLARQSGRSSSDALESLLEIERATSVIKVGDRFANGKRITSEAQAEQVRRSNAQFGAGLVGRIATLNPDLSGQEIGRIVAEAGSGPESFRHLASELGLNRRIVANIATAAEKGKIGSLLSKEEQARYGYKKGQPLGLGSLVSLALDRSGQTEAAAIAERGTKGFDVRRAKGVLQDFKAEEGERLQGGLNDLTKFVGGGKTATEAAEKLTGMIRGNEGKILGAGIGLEVLSKIPGMAKIAGIGGGGGVGGALSEATGGILGEKAIPVSIQNWGDAPSALPAAGQAGLGMLAKIGLVLGAGAAGYAAGTYLDRKFGISDYVAKELSPTSGSAFSGLREKQEAVQDAMTRVRALTLRSGRTASASFNALVGAGASPEYARSVAADFAGRFGGNVESQRSISIQIGNVSTAVGQTPRQIAETLVGPLADALAKHINVQTAGGLAR